MAEGLFISFLNRNLINVPGERTQSSEQTGRHISTTVRISDVEMGQGQPVHQWKTFLLQRIWNARGFRRKSPKSFLVQKIWC